MSELSRAESSKQKLLFAAFSLLKEGGVKSLSAAQIAKKASLSKSTFFHHFAQIDDFYIYILDSIINDFSQEANKEKFNNYQEYIRFSLNFAFEFIDLQPEVFTALSSIMDQSRNKPDTMKRFETMCHNNIITWSRFLQPLLPAHITKQQTTRLAYLIDMHFFGLCQHYLIDPNKQRLTDISEDFISMITAFIDRQK